MAKKNAPAIVKVTHTEMICWSIRFQEAQRDEFVQKAARAQAADKFEIESWCREEVNRIDAIIEVLQQMYMTETGVEYNG